MRPTTLIRAIPITPAEFSPGERTDWNRSEVHPGAAIHRAILALVWLTFALSSIVFTEPAPVDALLAGLSVLLPVAGLVAVTPALASYIALWAVAGACGLLAATISRDVAASTVFTSISLYLYVASSMLAGFVARDPARHSRVILSGWTAASVIAAIAALMGYFEILPGAHDLFTKFDRASGPFKDPNVFGPFLVAPVLYVLHLSLERSWLRAIVPLATAGLLALGILLSYSRGAWINLALAVAIYAVLAFITAATAGARERIVALVLSGAAVIALVTGVAVQDDRIGAFFKDRASLTQSYDEGPEGRFGGQQKAVQLILENPLGIGAGQFTSVYHSEEVHNVYLSMLLNAGWAGGLMFWLMTGLTIAIGLKAALVTSPARPLFLVAYAAFCATAAEGIVIDIDHWRSFYILMALVWGSAFSPFRSEEVASR